MIWRCFGGCVSLPEGFVRSSSPRIFYFHLHSIKFWIAAELFEQDLALVLTLYEATAKSGAWMRKLNDWKLSDLNWNTATENLEWWVVHTPLFDLTKPTTEIFFKFRFDFLPNPKMAPEYEKNPYWHGYSRLNLPYELPKAYRDFGGFGASERLPRIYFRQQPEFDGPFEIFKDRHNMKELTFQEEGERRKQGPIL